VDETAAVFERLGATVTKRVYPGLGHAIHPDEIARARGLLEKSRIEYQLGIADCGLAG